MVLKTSYRRNFNPQVQQFQSTASGFSAHGFSRGTKKCSALLFIPRLKPWAENPEAVTENPEPVENAEAVG